MAEPTEEAVRDLLARALERAPESVALVPGFELTRIQGNVYRLVTRGREFHVEWTPYDDELGRNELDVNVGFVSGSPAPAPRLLFTAKAGPGRVAVWERVEGSDLRSSNREALPEAFRVLGRFHDEHRHAGPVRSAVTTRTYPTIAEMVEAELAFFHSLLPADHALRQRGARVLAPLETGYPTLVHGDFHPGNTIRNDHGIFFLDWAYAHPGLNLLDLDYVQDARLGTPAEGCWWTIGPGEAGPVLAAYFETSGMGTVDTDAILRAVMLHSQLQSLHNCRRLGNEKGAEEVVRNIEKLMEE